MPAAQIATAVQDLAASFARPAASAAPAAISSGTATATGAASPAAPADATSTTASPTRQIVIQLNPENLGSVSVTMRMTGNEVEVQIRVANADTLDLLAKDRHVLTAAIAAVGGSADSLSLTSPAKTAAGGDSNPGASSGSSPDSSQQQASSSAGSAGSGGRRGGGSGTQDTPTTAWDEDYVPSRTAARAVSTTAFIFSLVGLLLGVARAETAASGNPCEAQMAAAAQRYEVPLAVFYAVGLLETGGRNGLRPFTMNIEGRSSFNDTLAAALTAFAEARRKGARLIDIGCMQINYRWHGDRFASVEQLFDPAHNVDYAARFLRDLKAREGSWTLAVARYNAGPNNNAAQKTYVCGVIRRMVASGFGAWTDSARAFCGEPSGLGLVSRPEYRWRTNKPAA